MTLSTGSFTQTTTTVIENDALSLKSTKLPTTANSHDYIKPESIRLAINGKWLTLSKEFVAKHPGGHVINQYRNSDATHIFHAFHEGSAGAYKQLKVLETLQASTAAPYTGVRPAGGVSVVDGDDNQLGVYDFSIEQEKQIVNNFERLRQHVHDEGLMEARHGFYARKCLEVTLIFAAAIYLQWRGWYLTSASVLALCWQQLGWLTHEFCHHQPFKNRAWNDIAALFLGNVAQGFSRDWWKDKHNVHHAATNVVGE